MLAYGTHMQTVHTCAARATPGSDEHVSAGGTHRCRWRQVSMSMGVGVNVDGGIEGGGEGEGEGSSGGGDG